MSQMRIARFVDIRACESIFSDYSTFVLRSSEHYRREHETDRGDQDELEVCLTGGGSASTLGLVISCWTILDGSEPTPEEWGIFQNTVAAILSTPSRVCTFLERAFEIECGKIPDKRRFPFMSVKHKRVTYADEVSEQITPDNIMEITVFTKRLRFAKQKEYRFALPYDMGPHVIDSYIFAKRPDDYMETCLANPIMGQEAKRALRLILLQATGGYGHFSQKKPCEIIANGNILLMNTSRGIRRLDVGMEYVERN